MREWVKYLARILAWPMRIFPFSWRRALLRSLLLLESRAGGSDTALRHLFAIADDVDRLISERATAYGNGVNPKHRLTGYHDFFVERLVTARRVLDLGCGIGEVARSIAARIPGVQVTGVDSDPEILAKAKDLPTPGNLRFVLANATQELPEGPWDAVILSNVLEHIDQRIAFLKAVVDKARPQCLLVRVPLFERHWHMPLRKELGVDFRSDPTHFIEHCLADFRGEMAAAGLEIKEEITLWGEIWARVEPKA